MNGSDAGANGALADFEFAFTGDQCGVAYLDSLHVGNRIVRTGCAVKWNSEIARARLGLGRHGSGQGEDRREDDGPEDEKEPSPADLRRRHKTSDKVGSIKDAEPPRIMRPGAA
jgi:hypothetical protein